MKKLLVVAVLPLTMVLAGAQGALAGDTFCPPALIGVTVDNVIVNGFCTMINTTVKGNVKVVKGGFLQMFGANTIAGNIQSDFGIAVQMISGPVIVGGDVQIKGATAASGYNPGVVTIHGDFQYEENSGFLVALSGVILGDLQMFKNKGGGIIGGNSIGGNLQCKENTPRPAPFGPNAVGGNKERQCRAALGF